MAADADAVFDAAPAALREEACENELVRFLIERFGATKRSFADFVALMRRPEIRAQLPHLRADLSVYEKRMDAAVAAAGDGWTHDSETDVSTRGPFILFLRATTH